MSKKDSSILGSILKGAVDLTAGTFPVAIVGGVVGFLMVKAFGDDDKKKK